MPNVAGIVAANAAKRASRVAELAGEIRHMPPPAIPAPPEPRPPQAQWRHPMQDQWDRRVHQFNVRNSALEPAPEGHVRLYRGGEIPAAGPARSLDDVIQGPFGPITRRELDAIKGGGHANPFEAEGRWFTDAPHELDFYLIENDTSPAYYIDVPADMAARHNVKNTPFMRNSRNPEREFVLPPEIANSSVRLLDGLKVK